MPSRMPSSGLRPIALIVTLWLTGCGGASFSPTVSACPPLVVYSAAEQKRAGDELAALPADSVVARMIDDYALERDQLRACRGEK